MRIERLAFLACLAATGCASIVSRTTREVSIKSQPDQARVEIVRAEGGPIYEGKTPAVIPLGTCGGYFRGARYRVRLSAPGFEDREVLIRGRLNPWYWGNLLVNIPVGMLVVDPLTGAMWTLSPREITETLVPKATPPVEGPKGTN